MRYASIIVVCMALCASAQSVEQPLGKKDRSLAEGRLIIH